MLLSGRPVYDPNPLRPNPNPEKSVSGSCRVRGLGRTLTPLLSLSLSVFNYIGSFTLYWSELLAIGHRNLTEQIKSPIQGIMNSNMYRTFNMNAI